MFNKKTGLILTLLSFVPIFGFFVFFIFTTPYLHQLSKSKIKECLSTILVGQGIVAFIYFQFYLLF